MNRFNQPPKQQFSRLFFLLVFVLNAFMIQANSFDFSPEENCETENSKITNKDFYFGVTISGLNTMSASSLTTSISVASQISCNGGADGALSANVSGGSAPFTYNWSNGSTSQTNTNLSAGTFTVTITDITGCTGTSSRSLSQPSALVASSTIDSNVSCNGGSDGAASVVGVGGTSPYTYNWSNGATTAMVTGLTAQTYTITVTDNNNCMASSTLSITEPSALSGVVISQGIVDCNNSVASATISASGGTPSYTYSWPSGGTNATEGGLNAGTHIATITDANSCMETVNVTIVSNTTPPIADAGPDRSLGCASSTLILDGSGSQASSTISYQWTTSGGNIVSGSTTNMPTINQAGTYTIRVTNSVNGCFATDDAIVTNVSSPTLSGVVTDVSCNGDSDGSIDLTVSGGQAAYTYNWSNGATNEDPTSLAAGTFTVTVTDANMCGASATFSVNQPSLVIASAIVDSNVTCFGGLDGGATASTTGGTSPYTYAWNNSATTASITGVSAGTFTVTVTDNNGCTGMASTTISQPSAMMASSTINSNVSCNGGSDGAASASASGGTPPYTYSWSNGATTATITGLTAGTYTITITDNNGCTDTSSETITESSAINITVSIDNNVSCNGLADGGASASASGGTSPYTYSWSNGGTSASIGNLQAGTYTITVTDNSGCTNTSSATITEPAVLVASAVVNSNISCNGDSDGMATASASGGTSPYTYAWSNGNTLDIIANLAVGTYTVTITDSNGCTDDANVIILEPSLLVATIVVDSTVTCNGFSDGGMTVSATGGTNPYTYNWSNSATTASITGVGAGTYSVTVTDNNACTSIASSTITEPTMLSSSLSATDETAPGANDGTASANPSGGTPAYTYSWSNGGTTQTISGLAGGTYTLTLTDANACTMVNSITVNGISCNLDASINKVNVSCFGGSDGIATAIPSMGTMPYTYSWNTGGTSASITGLSLGSYTVTVTDAANCIVVRSTAIEEPDEIISTTVVTHLSCAGICNGAIDLSVTGGEMPFSYLWSNGSGEEDIVQLCAGTYTVTITDANNCTSTNTATVTEPPLLVASSVVDSNASCNGFLDGGATASATGGTTPYTYSWSNGATTASITGVAAGTYIVTVTDGNGCNDASSVVINEPMAISANLSATDETAPGANDGTATANPSGGTPTYTYLWSNGSTTQTITNLAGGTYTTTVTDANGCTNAGSIMVNAVSCNLDATINKVDVLCSGGFDGIATVIPSLGTTPYTYLWSTSGTNASITGLIAGTYTVTVTDASNCTVVRSTTIQEPGAISLSTSVTNVTCGGTCNGAIDLSATGGTMPFSYQWSNGSGEEDILQLCAGTYTVTVTDANGCTAINSSTITEPSMLVASTVVDSNVICNGLATGGATAFATGGTMPYTYSWSNSATTASITGIGAGPYTVTVTDNNGCTSIADVTITEPTAIVIMISSTNETSQGANNGSAIASASGGTPGYQYTWSNGATTATIDNLAAGQYCVTVTDANGCTEEECVLIESGSCVLDITLSGNNMTCPGECTGAINVSAINGVMPFTYMWNDTIIGNSSVASNLCIGTYSVTVTDAGGCTATATLDIEEYPELNVQFATTSPSCFGVCDGSVNIVATGGTAPYSFNTSASDLSKLCTGDYLVTITDANGCSILDSFFIAETPAILLTVDSVGDATSGQSDGFIDISVTGGTAPYNYTWSLNGNQVSTDEDPNGLAAGEYILVLSDANGCMVIDTIIVDETTSIVPLSKTDEIRFMPNPVKNGVGTLQFKLESPSNVAIELYDLQGKLVQRIKQDNIQKERIQLDLHYLSAGIYGLVIIGNDFSYVEKIVIAE